jgi:hypothetical protein
VEFILEILLTAVVEGLLSVTGELLLELGFQSAGEAFTRRSRAHPVLAFGGIAMLGALTGLATALLLPARILQPSPVPGASLMLSPLFAGVLMEQYGRWRERRGGDHSFMATLWGGALFAFAMALVRFLLVA